ncbi:hypothetical protein, variant [Verruconis gallopava]|uniref:Phosphoinositide phospholipase C n=1 Tax=Verruconis gallopava TaxID=253628 RepID=A0A0D2ALP3_9PEZI|nr:hypothetical protein, variant [Verruconis gallopava]KIW07693.1 hypothetical protein, variant [Verruconis gallopava]
MLSVIHDKMTEKLASTKAAASTKLAGGGVTKYADPSKLKVEYFEAPVVEGLKKAYKHGSSKESTFEDFLQEMSSERSNALLPAQEQDLTHPLSNYFISSSHNTYLTGHQLYGRANVDGYKNVLLRGCRSVEIDVWDGEPPSSESSSDEEQAPPLSKTGKSSKRGVHDRTEPVVLHGYTATKDVSFRRVCETIRDNAFVTSKLPVIVSLEVHTSLEQQEIMVEIMEETFKGFLVDGEKVDDQKLPSPADLEEKILIKVKYSAPSPPKEGLSDGLSKTTTHTSGHSDGEEGQRQNEKPSNIIASLSKLGVYTRSYHFKSLTQPEASIPTHVFSLSEGTLSEVHKTDPEGLFNHNKDFLMRAYPRGTRISSSNLDPAPFWRQGVQMVALNWQSIDTGLMLNEAMFANTGGWVLKPPSHRSSAKYLGEFGGHGSSLAVQFIAGQNLQPPEGIEPNELKPYIKCELHVEIPNEWENLTNAKEKSRDEFKEKIDPVRGIHPDFKSQKVEFKQLPYLIPELSFVRYVLTQSSFGEWRRGFCECTKSELEMTSQEKAGVLNMTKYLYSFDNPRH